MHSLLLIGASRILEEMAPSSSLSVILYAPHGFCKQLECPSLLFNNIESSHVKNLVRINLQYQWFVLYLVWPHLLENKYFLPANQMGIGT